MEAHAEINLWPNEIKGHLCPFIPYNDLCSLSQTCTTWYDFTWSLKKVSDKKLTKLVPGILSGETVVFFPTSLPTLTSIKLPETVLNKESAESIFSLAKSTTELTAFVYKGVKLDDICCHGFYFRPDPSMKPDIKTLSEIITQNPKLQQFHAPGIYQGSKESFALLENSLAKSRIRELNMSGFWKVPTSLVQAVSKMERLQTLILNGCKFKAKHIAQSQSILASGRIRNLSLEQASIIGSSDVVLILKITSLNIRDMICPIPEFHNALIESLGSLKSLTIKVELFNKFERIKQFFQALEQNESIRRLEIADCLLETKHVPYLVNFLKLNNTCEELVFPNIAFRGPSRVIDLLCEDIHLSSLSLKNEQFLPSDLIRILKNNTSLRKLSITSSLLMKQDARPGAIGAAQILEALSKNTSMKQLVIHQIEHLTDGDKHIKNFDPLIKAYGLQDRIQITSPKKCHSHPALDDG